MKAIFNIGYTLPSPPANYTGSKRADYIAERNFYNLTSEYNYFSYSLDGRKVSKNANAENYFTREGTNTGLFNMDGVIDEAKKSEIKARLKETKSIIWHGFISFDDETSLGFNDQQNCIKFMRQTFGGFLEHAGFKKNNVQLYCSLHDDTDHRHIHFAFFEKEPLRRDKYGRVGFTRKGKIKPEALDNYLVSANMHLSEHGAEYYSARDKAIGEMKRIRDVHSRTGFIDGRPSTSSLAMNLELNKLLSKLPPKGRLQYASENMRELRPQIDRVADLLIKSDASLSEAHGQMLRELARVEKEVKGLAIEGKLGYLQGKRLDTEQLAVLMGEDKLRNKRMGIEFLDLGKVDYFERLKEDYKARIGNVVLGMCKDILYSRSHEPRRIARVNDFHKKIEAKGRRKYQRNLLYMARSAMCAICHQENANFLKSVKEHERDIEFENIYGTSAR